MKNIFLKIAYLGLLVSATSCTDFLTEKPKSEMSTSQYFTQPDHAHAAVNKLYREGAVEFYATGDVYSGTRSMWGGYIAGLYNNEYAGQEVVVQYSQSLTHTAVNVANQMDIIWDVSYRAIARANTAIKYIPTTPGLDESEKSTLLAQAKFFRAFNYFYLVKFFGDVPLITEPYESLEEMYVARTASAEVYALIEKDLKEAIDAGLNDAAFTQNGFRITKAVVEMLQANVYLQMSGFPIQANRYTDAATAARNIINSNKHALETNGETPEESAYNKLRTSDDLKEIIYSREYLVGIENSGMVQYSFPNSASGWGILKYSITNNAYGPRDYVLNAYDAEKDLRIQEKQFFFKNYSYEKDGETVNIELASHAPWFYYNEKALLETGISDKDVNIYRYAEVLLIAAEAIAQSEGVTAEAVGYLADVRARAYTTSTKDDIIAELSGLSKENFIKEVWAERFRELQFDGRIWDDIQRTRMYPQTSEDSKGKMDFINVVGATSAFGATFQEKHLLWPISTNEIQRNPSLVQNPGF